MLGVIKNFLIFIFPVSFCASLVYQKILFHFFSINIDGYFSIDDYIQSTIYSMLLPIFEETLFFLLIMSAYSFFIYQTKKPSLNANSYSTNVWIRIASDILLTFLFVLIILLIHKAMSKNPWENLTSLSHYIFFLLALLFIKIEKFIKEPKKVFLLLAILFVFFSASINSAYEKYKGIISNENYSYATIKIDPSLSLATKEKNLVLIEKTTNYYFLYDKESKKAIILPSDKVQYIISGSIRNSESN